MGHTPGRGRVTLPEMDGLLFRRNSRRLPHPVELARWTEAGFYTVDADNDCFRLTAKGRAAIQEESLGKRRKVL